MNKLNIIKLVNFCCFVSIHRIITGLSHPTLAAILSRSVKSVPEFDTRVFRGSFAKQIILYCYNSNISPFHPDSYPEVKNQSFFNRPCITLQFSVLILVITRKQVLEALTFFLFRYNSK